MSDKTQNTEKKMTKYDRKMEARRLQEEKEKKESIRNRIIAVAMLALVVVAVLSTTLSSTFAKRAALKETYVKVGDHEVTKLEYDYFYYYMVNQYLNQYSSILSYMGLDTSVSFDEQQYSDDMTWKDYFDQMTVSQIQQTKALSDEIKETGWTCDITEDYNNAVATIRNSASEAGVSVENYYQAMYGAYATQKNVKPFMEETLKVSQYVNHLYEENAPTEEEVTAYYEENKNDYDSVDYYEAVFEAVAEDGDEEAEEGLIATAMAAAKEKAEAMKARLEAGEDFETLCAEYLPEDTADELDEEESEEANTDPHLMVDGEYAYTSSYYRDWLFAQERTAGELTLVENETNRCYYLVKFVERNYHEDCRETISDTLADEVISAHLEELTADYTVTDVKGELVYLTLEEEETEDFTEDSAEDFEGEGDSTDGWEEESEESSKE